MYEHEIISTSINFVTDYIKGISKELNLEHIANLVNEVVDAKRIFLLGAGRSGLEARAFAMRLMHMGFDVYVIGSATAPLPKYFSRCGNITNKV